MVLARGARLPVGDRESMAVAALAWLLGIAAGAGVLWAWWRHVPRAWVLGVAAA
jgi:hypothetical protein